LTTRLISRQLAVAVGRHVAERSSRYDVGRGRVDLLICLPAEAFA